MSVYCEPRPEADLLDDLSGAKGVLLVGCPMCANLSSAVQNDVAAYALGLRGLVPEGIDYELGRLSGALGRRGIRVERWLPGMPGTLCGLGGSARRKLRALSEGVDAVITLGCESGEGNVREILGGARVVGAMRAKGLFAKRMRRGGLGRVVVDKSSVRIEPFTLESRDQP